MGLNCRCWLRGKVRMAEVGFRIVSGCVVVAQR